MGVFRERQITFAPHGHLLTNAHVWSADGAWLVYDLRSDAAGSLFDGPRIERVHVETGAVEVLYTAPPGAHCGVVTCSPCAAQVVFIHGPEAPTVDWSYSACHRRGVLVDTHRPGVAINVDACNLVPPFTPGALRGGSHVHTFSADGTRIAFTYEDHLLTQQQRQQRNIGVSVAGRSVAVPRTHSRNHDGSHFSVLVTRTVAQPRPGSDDISRACEESWLGTSSRAIAFQGQVVTPRGTPIYEVFLVELPHDLTVPGSAPLEGTAVDHPAPPQGTVQRRLSFTAERRHPGISGPRHWLRSDPAGQRIAFLLRDEAGIVQIWTIAPMGGEPQQVSHNPHDIGSAFTWSPDGRWLAHVMDGSVCVTEAESGQTHRLTPPVHGEGAPRPEACVFSPTGRQIAYLRRVPTGAHWYNQLFVVSFAAEALP